ncbi:MAG: hypothetical protein ACKO0W_00365 [Planctomycetota bacterium]
MTRKTTPLLLVVAACTACALAGCWQPHKASPDPRAQQWPSMRKRLFHGVEPEFAVRTAAWTLADLGRVVNSIDLEKGVVRALGPSVWVTKSGPSSVLVEFGYPIEQLPRVVDPDYYESFFVPYATKLGAKAELVELPPLQYSVP